MLKEIQSWISVQIKDIARTQSGGTPSTNKADYWDGDVPWINSSKLKDTIILEPSRFITKLGLKESSARLFPKDTVVIALTGATTGKVGILGIETATNQSVTGILPNEYFEPKYIYYQLIYLRPYILSQALGTAQPHINKRIVDDTQILLAPLAEQKRIISKLDEAFQHLETLKAKLKRIPELLKKFRETVLTHAVTGDIDNYVTLGEFNIVIQTGPFGSALHKEDYIENGIPLINPSHIKDGRLVPDLKVAITNEKAEELRVWLLKDNDVVLGRRGEMGRAAVYDKLLGKMLCGTGSLILRSSESISSKFLMYYLRSPFCVNYLTNNSVGSTMVNLNQGILKSLPFPNLSRIEQEAVIEKIDTAFEKVAVIEARFLSLKEVVETLPQGILNKAFKGELVSQNENDEPAGVLLERIREAKALNKKVDKLQEEFAF